MPWPAHLSTWTTAQVSDLRRLWNEKPADEIAALVGHPVQGVRSKAHRIGLPFQKRRTAWTGREDELRQLWADRLPAFTIAEIMGISRNAVIGKAWRLKLTPRPAYVMTDEERAQRLREGRTARRPRERGRARRMKPLPTASAAPANAPEPGNVPLMQISPMGCKYATGWCDRTERHLFCDAMRDHTGPYCPWHAAVAYRFTPSSADPPFAPADA